MPIRFRCTNCDRLMIISQSQAGTEAECPTCGKITSVPLHEVTPDVAPPAAPVEIEFSSIGSADVPIEFQSVDLIEHDDQQRIQLHENVTRHAAGLVSAGHRQLAEQVVLEEADSAKPLKFRRRRTGDDDMDLTPMVDVTFQLLIFFMVSASFSLQKSIEVPTPDADQKGASQQMKTLDDLQGTSLIVKIDATNSIWLDDDPVSDPTRLADTLKDKMRREQKTELLIMAHTAALHRSTILVIDAANEIGVQKIRMASNQSTN